MLYACRQQSEPSEQRREGKEPDQTDTKKNQRKTPNQKEKQKGLGANLGHENIPEFTFLFVSRQTK